MTTEHHARLAIYHRTAGHIDIQIGYSSDLDATLNLLKARIPDHARQWNPATQEWRINAVYEQALRDLFDNYDYIATGYSPPQPVPTIASRQPRNAHRWGNRSSPPNLWASVALLLATLLLFVVWTLAATSSRPQTLPADDFWSQPVTRLPVRRLNPIIAPPLIATQPSISATVAVTRGANITSILIPAGATQAQVTNIVDGDTIDVTINGQPATVRYIGIDTPERGQPGYTTATQANADLVQNQTVYLERDVSDTDQYDRLLRNVYLPDGTWVNGQLVAMGLAQPVRYEPDTAYAAELEQAARDAALTRSGFWAGGPDAMPYAQVATGANLRKGPGTNFEINRDLPADTPLTVFGRNEDATWFQVRTPAHDGGWMAATALTLNVAAAIVPVADAIPKLPAATATTSAEGSLRIIAVDKRAEYIVIRNDGSVPVNLRDWTVVSEKGNQRWKVAFDFELAPGATVTVHAFEGTNDRANLYSGFGSNIWNNREPDPAVLLDPEGRTVSRFPQTD